jgi:hypothetical protein
MKTTMKTRATPSVLAALLVAGAATAGAATLVVDDFTQGGFAVSQSYRTMRESDLSLPAWGGVSRLASGRGSGYWHASSTAQLGGSMNYTLELRGDPPYGVNYLDIGYARSEVFDLSGYDAFSLTVSGLVGRGEIVAYSGGAFRGTPVPITGTGELLIPFSMMDNTASIDRLTSLHFRVIGLTADFSVTIDRIAAVPEPGSLGLFAGGMAVLLATRRRRRA